MCVHLILFCKRSEPTCPANLFFRLFFSPILLKHCQILTFFLKTPNTWFVSGSIDPVISKLWGDSWYLFDFNQISQSVYLTIVGDMQSIIILEIIIWNSNMLYILYVINTYSKHFFFFQKIYCVNFMTLSIMKNSHNSFKGFFQHAIYRAIFVWFWKPWYHYDRGNEIFNVGTQSHYFELFKTNLILGWISFQGQI